MAWLVLVFLLHGDARSCNFSCLGTFFNLPPYAKRAKKPIWMLQFLFLLMAGIEPRWPARQASAHAANQHCYWVAHSSILVKHSLLIAWISLACHVGLVLTWSSSMTSVLIPQSLASSQRFFILRVDSNDSSVTWLHFSCRDSSSVSGGPSSSAWGCPDILARGRGTSSRTNARIQLLLQPFISCWLITVEFETRRTTNFVCAGKKRKINFCY